MTLMCGAPAVVDRGARRRRDVGRPDPRHGTACASSSPAHRRRRARSSASRPSSAGSSSRSTGSPRRRRCSPINRASRRVRRPRRRRTRARKLGRAGAPALGVRAPRRRPGRGARAVSNVVLEGYWEQPEATADAIVDGWFHTGDGGTVDDEGYLIDLRPQEGRDHQRRRERLVDRGRGRALLAPRGRRGGGHRRARREVGRDGEGAGRAGAGRRRSTRPSSSSTAAAASRTSSARRRSSSATSSPAPPPASCRSSSSARRTGRAASARSG